MGKLEDSISTYGRLASELKTIKKTPTGIFPVDFYLDGGAMEGRIFVAAGKYHGGKTTMLYKLISQSQKKYTKKMSYIFDIEGTFEPSKALDHGVDLNRLIILRPETGGEAADMICSLLVDRAEDIGVIGIDSVNKLTNSKEFDKDADDHTIAYNASIMTKLLNRVVNKLNSLSFTHELPIVFCISQIRANMGFGFKDYKIPGAKALEHDASTILVTNQGKVYEDVPNKEIAFSDFNVIFDKVKSSSFNVNKIEYTMCVGRDQKFADGSSIPTGFVDDWNFVLAQAKSLGMHSGGGPKQHLNTPELEEIVFKNQDEMLALFYANEDVYARFKDRVLAKRREHKRILGNEPYMEYIWGKPKDEATDEQAEAVEEPTEETDAKTTRKKSKKDI